MNAKDYENHMQAIEAVIEALLNDGYKEDDPTIRDLRSAVHHLNVMWNIEKGLY
jgi:hypothetical protein